MRSAIIAASVASVLPAAMALTINTPPQLVQCQPVALSWSDGEPPYFLSVYPGGQSSGALIQFAQQQDASFRWTVNITAGTSVTLGVLDNTGTNAYTSPLDIQSGSSSECLNGGGETTSSGEPTTSETSASEPTPTVSQEPTTSASEPSTSAPESSTTGESTSTRPTTSPSESPSGDSGNSGEDDGDFAFRSQPAALGLAAVLAVVGAAVF